MLAYLPLLAVLVVAARVPAPLPRAETRPLTEAARAEIVREHAMVEAGLVARARRSFPGDLWSQGDDVANGERRWLAQVASFRGTTVTALLPVVDEGLRAARAEGDRRGIVAPCMPRPFYD